MPRRLDVNKAITDLASLRSPTAWSGDVTAAVEQINAAIDALDSLDTTTATVALASITRTLDHAHLRACQARNRSIAKLRASGHSNGQIAKVTKIGRTNVIRLAASAHSSLPPAAAPD